MQLRVFGYGPSLLFSFSVLPLLHLFFFSSCFYFLSFVRSSPLWPLSHAIVTFLSVLGSQLPLFLRPCMKNPRNLLFFFLFFLAHSHGWRGGQLCLSSKNNPRFSVHTPKTSNQCSSPRQLHIDHFRVLSKFPLFRGSVFFGFISVMPSAFASSSSFFFCLPFPGFFFRCAWKLLFSVGSLRSISLSFSPSVSLQGPSIPSAPLP